VSFELLRSKVLMKGRTFNIRQDIVKTPNGREKKREIIEHGGSAVLIPVDENGNLLLVRQYRHATGKDLLELPAGTLEEDEDPDVCAARELREETGMAAGTLKKLGAFYLAPGYSDEYMHVYLATELSDSPLEPDDDEFLTVEAVPIMEAIRMAERGEIPDAKSLAALFLGRSTLENWL